MEWNRIVNCIQVCYEINDMNMGREFDALLEALNFFNQKTGIIVTYNQSDAFNKTGKNIILKPGYEFLSDD